MSERRQYKPDQYHINPQQANALLDPVRATLRELEGRLQHFVGRMPLEPADEAALRNAHQVLATAHRDIERLWQEANQIPRS